MDVGVVSLGVQRLALRHGHHRLVGSLVVLDMNVVVLDVERLVNQWSC